MHYRLHTPTLRVAHSVGINRPQKPIGIHIKHKKRKHKHNNKHSNFIYKLTLHIFEMLKCQAGAETTDRETR